MPTAEAWLALGLIAFGVSALIFGLAGMNEG